MLAMTSVVTANEPHVAAKVMDGEAIVINITTGAYYSGLGVAGFIWSLIEHNPSIEDIVRAVVAQYDVPLARAEADALQLCVQLRDEGLVNVAQGEHSVGAAPVVPAAKDPYETPAFEKFTDMADTFALDPPLPGLANANNGL